MQYTTMNEANGAGVNKLQYYPRDTHCGELDACVSGGMDLRIDSIKALQPLLDKFGDWIHQRDSNGRVQVLHPRLFMGGGQKRALQLIEQFVVFMYLEKNGLADRYNMISGYMQGVLSDPTDPMTPTPAPATTSAPEPEPSVPEEHGPLLPCISATASDQPQASIIGTRAVVGMWVSPAIVDMPTTVECTSADRCDAEEAAEEAAADTPRDIEDTKTEDSADRSDAEEAAADTPRDIEDTKTEDTKTEDTCVVVPAPPVPVDLVTLDIDSMTTSELCSIMQDVLDTLDELNTIRVRELYCKIKGIDMDTLKKRKITRKRLIIQTRNAVKRATKPLVSKKKKKTKKATKNIAAQAPVPVPVPIVVESKTTELEVDPVVVPTEVESKTSESVPPGALDTSGALTPDTVLSIDFDTITKDALLQRLRLGTDFLEAKKGKRWAVSNKIRWKIQSVLTGTSFEKLKARKYAVKKTNTLICKLVQ